MLEVSFVIVTPSLVGSGSEPTLDLATVVDTNAVAPDNIPDLKCKKERSNRLWTNHLCFKNSFLMHQPLKILADRTGREWTYLSLEVRLPVCNHAGRQWPPYCRTFVRRENPGRNQIFTATCIC